MNNPLIKKVLESLKIQELNPMQKAALEIATNQKDLILLSPTGSGKTIAFLLPMILNLKPDNGTIQALILAPSRELALQINSVFQQISVAWKSCCCYGGHSITEEKKSILGNKPAIIIGTPGRITDHIAKGNFDPSTIHMLIIDEFDKSLELGFHEQMEEIIDQLPNLKKRILLSATDAEEIPEFTGIQGTVKLDFLDHQTSLEDRLTVKRIVSPAKDKLDTLFNLLCSLNNKSSIVFCNHRDAVDRVHKILSEKKLETEKFHGGMEQPDREKSLYKFRNGSCNILISTDLAARGLDITDIENVIHYHLPINEEAYTHRNGRTARWDATGTSYVIVNESEQLPSYVPYDIATVELLMHTSRPPKSKWITLYIGKGKKDKLSKMDIAGFLHKKGSLAREDIGQIDVKDHYSFVAIKRAKANQLFHLIQGEKIKGMKTIIQEAK